MTIDKANTLVPEEFKTKAAMRLMRKDAEKAPNELLRIVMDTYNIGHNFDAISICIDFSTGEMQTFIRFNDGNVYMEKVPNISYICYHLMQRCIVDGEIKGSDMMRYVAKVIDGGKIIRTSFVHDHNGPVNETELFNFFDEPDADPNLALNYTVETNPRTWKEMMQEVIL